MKKLVILDGKCIIQNDLNFNNFTKVCNVRYFDRTDKNKIIDNINDAEIVLTNKTPIDKEILDKCKNIKFISVLATGYNVVDVEYANKLNVIVSNVPAYSTESVVQHTFALILDLFSKISIHNSAVKNGKWAETSDFSLMVDKTYELKGKTLGIIGYGSIGKRVAEVARAFGMNVVINTRTPVEDSVDLQTLLANSDVISLHCPLTNSNFHLINSETLKYVKDNAIIINTARGSLIDEEAIARALNDDKLGGYACDVLSQEPPTENIPLFGAKNCIITPHIAWATKEARSRLIDITYQNVLAYISGNPINIVN